MGARGCVHLLAIVNRAAVNLAVHIFPQDCFQCLWVLTQQWDCWITRPLLFKKGGPVGPFASPPATSEGGEPGHRLGCTREAGGRESRHPHWRPRAVADVPVLCLRGFCVPWAHGRRRVESGGTTPRKPGATGKGTWCPWKPLTTAGRLGTLTG